MRVVLTHWDPIIYYLKVQTQGTETIKAMAAVGQS